MGGGLTRDRGSPGGEKPLIGTRNPGSRGFHPVLHTTRVSSSDLSAALKNSRVVRVAARIWRRGPVRHDGLSRTAADSRFPRSASISLAASPPPVLSAAPSVSRHARGPASPRSCASRGRRSVPRKSGARERVRRYPFSRCRASFTVSGGWGGPGVRADARCGWPCVRAEPAMSTGAFHPDRQKGSPKASWRSSGFVSPSLSAPLWSRSGASPL